MGAAEGQEGKSGAELRACQETGLHSRDTEPQSGRGQEDDQRAQTWNMGIGNSPETCLRSAIE